MDAPQRDQGMYRNLLKSELKAVSVMSQKKELKKTATTVHIQIETLKCH